MAECAATGWCFSFRPQIARVWNHYQFRVNYQGAVIDVVVDKTQAAFKMIEVACSPKTHPALSY